MGGRADGSVAKEERCKEEPASFGKNETEKEAPAESLGGLGALIELMKEQKLDANVTGGSSSSGASNGGCGAAAMGVRASVGSRSKAECRKEEPAGGAKNEKKKQAPAVPLDGFGALIEMPKNQKLDSVTGGSSSSGTNVGEQEKVTEVETGAERGATVEDTSDEEEFVVQPAEEAAAEPNDVERGRAQRAHLFIGYGHTPSKVSVGRNVSGTGYFVIFYDAVLACVGYL